MQNRLGDHLVGFFASPTADRLCIPFYRVFEREPSANQLPLMSSKQYYVS
jgi:hypothetical protein